MTGDETAEIRLIFTRGHPQRTTTVRERLTTTRSGYDLSNGERGKMFRKNTELHLPIYLADEVLAYLQERARAKGVELNELVNAQLQEDRADRGGKVDILICFRISLAWDSYDQCSPHSVLDS